MFDLFLLKMIIYDENLIFITESSPSDVGMIGLSVAAGCVTVDDCVEEVSFGSTFMSNIPAGRCKKPIM